MNLASKLAATALFAATLIFSGCGQGQIAAVDVDKVMAEAPRVKTLMSEAEGKIKEAQQKYEQDAAAKPDMTDEETAKLQMDFQRKLEGINQAYATQIKSRMDVVIEELSREKNIDVVINNSANDKLIFHGALDVTDDVIKKMQ